MRRNHGGSHGGEQVHRYRSSGWEDDSQNDKTSQGDSSGMGFSSPVPSPGRRRRGANEQPERQMRSLDGKSPRGMGHSPLKDGYDARYISGSSTPDRSYNARHVDAILAGHRGSGVKQSRSVQPMFKSAGILTRLKKGKHVVYEIEEGSSADLCGLVRVLSVVSS